MDWGRSFGKVTAEQIDALRRHVAGKWIRDYGCGRMILTQLLVALGAEHVEAIDKEPWDVPSPVRDKVTFLEGYYQSIITSPKLAFVSWPATNPSCLLHVQLRYAEMVIYLGMNFGGTSCGYPGLFAELSRRKVLEHVPDRKNTLIIYGEIQSTRRQLLPEEYAGLHTCLEHIYDYSEMESLKTARVRPELRREFPHLFWW